MSPIFISWFSVKLSFGPLNIVSLDDSVIPLSSFVLVSTVIALLVPSTNIQVNPDDNLYNTSL